MSGVPGSRSICEVVRRSWASTTFAVRQQVGSASDREALAEAGRDGLGHDRFDRPCPRRAGRPRCSRPLHHATSRDRRPRGACANGRGRRRACAWHGGATCRAARTARSSEPGTAGCWSSSSTNSGNVTESIARARSTLSLYRGGRRIARLVAEPRELRPGTRGIVQFRYRGRLTAASSARRIVPESGGRVLRRAFRVRLCD